MFIIVILFIDADSGLSLCAILVKHLFISGVLQFVGSMDKEPRVDRL